MIIKGCDNLERLDRLKEEMKKENIDFYVIPSADPHKSEYISDHWKTREYFSGFTGSAGTLVVSEEETILWTDGRYFVQAEKELEGSGIKLYKIGIKGYPKLKDYIRERLQNEEVLGVYGKLVSVSEFKSWTEGIDSAAYSIIEDLPGRIWKDRPELENSELFILEDKYTGESVKSKLKRLREYMDEKDEHIHVTSSLDEIAYLYNLRGRDIENNPVFISYSIVKKDEAFLFTDGKINDEIRKHAENEGFEIRPLSEFEEELEEIRLKNVGLDPEKTNIWIKEKLNFNKILYNPEILTEFEALRNKIQIENMKKAHIRDGVAVIKTLNYIYKNIDEEITETDISRKLIEYRSECEEFIEPSFDTIAAYKDHGAMMHYCADKDSEYTLERDGLLLIDSGGHYLTGTTDITRTFTLGNPTKLQIRDYTLALKGMINLSRMKFLEGTSGATLDITAREFLWREGRDYKCGTGHGVGYLLSVHLGNQRISPAAKNVLFKPGMVVTNEPGVYRPGEYGIRIENMLLVRESSISEDDDFLEFETLTLCPFDKRLIDFSLITEREANFLRDYHGKMRERLSKYLTEEERELIWYI